MTYNQPKIPAKKEVKTELVLSQQITMAKTLPIPIPPLINVREVSLSSWAKTKELCAVRRRIKNSVLSSDFMVGIYF